MINLHADYPGLFKFYGFFIKTWCLENDYFKLADILKNVDCGNEEEDEYYDIQDFWEKFIQGYITYCHDVEGYDKVQVEEFYLKKLEFNEREMKRSLQKAMSKKKC